MMALLIPLNEGISKWSLLATIHNMSIRHLPRNDVYEESFMHTSVYIWFVRKGRKRMQNQHVRRFVRKRYTFVRLPTFV